ncbi:cation:proton antiporter [uncultured Desulfosarcina sp.]|uniref:cation:proton antiporter domain-containing protein n=1 Tax=uncultured Desulfosarcina sp. TaxID=218289 RepID=UPI0029C91B4D|nr:cation:proton antiporter [uncultured Desulfosarcina sp.]
MGHTTLILATLLGAGFVLAKVCQRLHLPSVTGYIAAGLLLGPVGLNWVNAGILEGRLEHFTEIALMLVAFGIGEHLEIERLRPILPMASRIGLGETLGTCLITFAGCLIVSLATQGAVLGSLSNHLTLAILLGAIAVATAPASTLHVMKELKAAGPLSSTLLAIVAFNNGLAIVFFGVTVAVSGQLGGGESHWCSSLAIAGAQIAASLILGATTGWIMDRAIHRLKNESEMLTLGLTLLLLCGESASMLNLSPLLAGMAAGFVVVNRDRRDVRVFRTINAFEPPILVLFFTLAGCHIDPEALLSCGWLGLAYFLARGLGKQIGAGTGARIAGAPRTVGANIGLALIPQAGIAIGLVFLVQGDPNLTMFSSVITPVVLTGVVLSELIGPACTRMAVVRAGESRVSDTSPPDPGLGIMSDRDKAGAWEGHRFPTTTTPRGVVVFGAGHPETLIGLARLSLLLAYVHHARPLAVRVLAGVDPPRDADPNAHAKSLFAVAAGTLNRMGGTLQTLTIESDTVSDGLLSVASRMATRALILGFPRETSQRKFQTILEKVVGQADCPVIIAHINRLQRIGRILVPFVTERELHVLTTLIDALTLLGPQTVTLLWMLPCGVSPQEVELHREILRAWTERVNLASPVEPQVIETRARLETILEASADQDLIVMATRTGYGLSRIFWGSLAETVHRHANKPMLIVHHRSPVTRVGGSNGEEIPLGR